MTGLAMGLMLIALAAGPIDVGLLTLRQRRTDPAELGRVLSVSMSLNLAGIPLGSALAGMLMTVVAHGDVRRRRAGIAAGGRFRCAGAAARSIRPRMTGVA